ncbi:poly [ADP-ribose] polymerase tankyrase-2-like isoform X2 [Branchiostoma floridae]|uniref:Poly [ADP-ribose] polymerase tankyrase-2-like isoform X2 n=1 Tax=Branchiostoma floridae TaxID=7739 RepID=A0A9J7MY42_BRAFL|nr:poly [ADP-ribose] polymerase tankyrase-2-like isoform X2 [Branchiostoma floridae]
MAVNVNEALLVAAMHGSLRGVEVALKAGADIDFDKPDTEITSSGTALFIASRFGHVDIVRLLLRKGASVVKRSRGSYAPLHMAATQGNTEIVDLLVQHGATLDIRDGFQYTPLMTACIYRKVDTARRLIELGARPDLTDGDHQVALRYSEMGAAFGSRGSKECLKLIQEAIKSKLLRCCNPACGKPGYRKSMKLCGRCKLTRYCSRDCQMQHWSVGHKKCCGHDEYPDEGLDPFQKMLKNLSVWNLLWDVLIRAGYWIVFLKLIIIIIGVGVVLGVVCRVFSWGNWT